MSLDMKLLPTVEDFTAWYEATIPRFLTVLVVLLFLVVLYTVLTWFIKNRLTRHAKNERQMASVRVFLRLWRYVIITLFFLIVVFTYTNSLTALGLGAGFIGAALGWALQSPITGIVAWLMVIFKKPFQPGDRVIIDDIQGDVYDITLSHVILEEFGGTTSEDERSGRFIMIPTSTLFTAKIVNFTLNDEYVLQEVPVTITYESNLEKAMKIMHQAALKHAKDAIKAKKVEPVERISFLDSAIEARIKYFVDVRHRAEVATKIRKEIFEQFKRSKDIEISYPHMQIVMEGKTGPEAPKSFR